MNNKREGILAALSLEWVVQGVKTDLLDYNEAASGFYVKCNGESDSVIFSHFRSSLATRNCARKKYLLKSKYFFNGCLVYGTRIFKKFGALLLYFEYASFKYHKQNIR